MPATVLSRGLLSGHWSAQRDLAANDFRARSPRFQGDNLDRNLALVERLRALAEAKGGDDRPAGDRLGARARRGPRAADRRTLARASMVVARGRALSLCRVIATVSVELFRSTEDIDETCANRDPRPGPRCSRSDGTNGRRSFEPE